MHSFVTATVLGSKWRPHIDAPHSLSSTVQTSAVDSAQSLELLDAALRDRRAAAASLEATRKSKRHEAGMPKPSAWSHRSQRRASPSAVSSACCMADMLHPKAVSAASEGFMAFPEVRQKVSSPGDLPGGRSLILTTSMLAASSEAAKLRQQTTRNSQTTSSIRSCTRHRASGHTSLSKSVSTLARPDTPVKGRTCSPIQLKASFATPR
mmetsp:Transcript_148858/g.277474  ORF Transcript_148858/g.277474 Transcript_148858/m.277474 type:complete len:209 (+) Transcript_148858:386-1012(+)